MVAIEGKGALVTGGAVRVGRALVEGLAQAGVDVAIHYHQSAEAAQDTVVAIRGLGVKALALQADLSDPDAVRVLIEQVQENFGGVDILVHSASPFFAGSLQGVTLDRWRHVMGAVVEGFLLLAQALAPQMVARGRGDIITILDEGAFDPWPRFLAHSAAKSALWSLTRSLAVELAPEVRVNSVVGGPLLPPPGHSADRQATIARATLLQRWGSPADLVDAVLFLLRSDYITGEALFVDGGQRWAHRRGPLKRPGARPP
jgi:NAD(P)-dependent dehydrogenase (short-subunit alcohol dehydrogenase family)